MKLSTIISTSYWTFVVFAVFAMLVCSVAPTLAKVCAVISLLFVGVMTVGIFIDVFRLTKGEK